MLLLGSNFFVLSLDPFVMEKEACVAWHAKEIESCPIKTWRYLFQRKSAYGTGWSVIKIAVKAGTAKHMATGCSDWFIKQPK